MKKLLITAALALCSTAASASQGLSHRQGDPKYWAGNGNLDFTFQCDQMPSGWMGIVKGNFPFSCF